MDPDAAIRASAFAAMAQIVRRRGSLLRASIVRQGFEHGGRRIHFANFAQGIFQPKELRDACLSITTVVPRSGTPRYDDDVGSDADHFVYRYRDDGRDSRDNRALRAAYLKRLPIIYFKGVEPGLYSAIWPCYVTADDPTEGFVHVEIGVATVDLQGAVSALLPDVIERRYVIRERKVRLHQQRFRQIVLRAYAERCTICRLHETVLLEASHILPDRDRRGEASVPNGLSLCSIHHDAYDRDLLAVTPDYRVRLSRRLLDDEDGPMLEQGLKAFHEGGIHLPRAPQDQPSREFLEERLAQFERAA